METQFEAYDEALEHGGAGNCAAASAVAAMNCFTYEYIANLTTVC